MIYLLCKYSLFDTNIDSDGQKDRLAHDGASQHHKRISDSTKMARIAAALAPEAGLQPHQGVDVSFIV
jgi:hypothetical protein